MTNADSDKKAGKKSLIWFGVLLALLAIALSGYFWSSSEFQEPAGPPEKLVIAGGNQPNAASVYVAVAKGYFAEEGLDVAFAYYPSGKDALKVVLEAKADMAIVAETPIVLATLQGQKLALVAAIATTEKSVAILARKDRGIFGPGDLKGKKIGVPFGTSGQFFLDVFLTSRRVPREQVRVLDLKPEAAIDALVKGNVDAISIWSLYDYRARKELGDNALTLYGEGIYIAPISIVVTQAFINEKRAVVKRALRALVKSSDFMARKPEESQRIVAEETKTDRRVISELWNAYNFAITLDQSILTTMEDQARWAIKNKLTEATQVPNYLNFIYLDGLKAVRPEGVKIIH